MKRVGYLVSRYIFSVELKKANFNSAKEIVEISWAHSKETELGIFNMPRDSEGNSE